MAMEDLAESMEGKGWLGLLVGAAVLAPALPAVSRKLRPAAKGAVKGYLTLKEKAAEWFAETGEQWQDLVAEARAEYDEGGSGAEMMTLEPAPEAETRAEKPRRSGGSRKRATAKTAEAQ